MKKLIPSKKIALRVKAMGREITRFYAKKVSEDNPLIIVCVLRGGFVFTADLMREIKLPLKLETLRASSYVGKKSSGKITIYDGPKASQPEQHILLIEDIVDTGLTSAYLLKHFKAKSVKIASLLSKPSQRKIRVKIDFLGFEIDDHFVVGYGLDYNQLHRNLSDVCVAK